MSRVISPFGDLFVGKLDAYPCPLTNQPTAADGRGSRTELRLRIVFKQLYSVYARVFQSTITRISDPDISPIVVGLRPMAEFLSLRGGFVMDAKPWPKPAISFNVIGH